MANDLGKLILRLTLGVLMLLHGIAKITGGTAGGREDAAKGPGCRPFLRPACTSAKCSPPSS